jgi:hypothetical protein
MVRGDDGLGEGNIVRQKRGVAQVRGLNAGPGESGGRRSGEGEVVGAIGDQFVTEGLANFAALQEKSAGHALDIAGGKADKVAFEPGEEHALNAFGVEILAELGVSEAEGVVKLAAGVGEARQVIKLVGREKFGGAFFRAEVHESERGALRLNLLAKFG